MNDEQIARSLFPGLAWDLEGDGWWAVSPEGTRINVDDGVVWWSREREPDLHGDPPEVARKAIDEAFGRWCAAMGVQR